MTTFQANNEIIHFDDKFGLITENQVIISKGSTKNKVNFDSINNVNLIKSRVFYFNFIAFILSLSVFVYTFTIFKSERLEFFYGLILIGIFLLIYSFIHKFYIYKLVIKEKNHSTIVLKTTQINRKNIKEFYKAIISKIPKK